MGKLTIGPDVKHHPDNRESQELFVCDNTDNTDIIGTLNILKQEFPSDFARGECQHILVTVFIQIRLVLLKMESVKPISLLLETL